MAIARQMSARTTIAHGARMRSADHHIPRTAVTGEVHAGTRAVGRALPAALQLHVLAARVGQRVGLLGGGRAPGQKGRSARFRPTGPMRP